mgnify:CR=1 FL=1
MLVSAFLVLSIVAAVSLVAAVRRHRVAATKAIVALVSASSLSAIGFVSTASAGDLLGAGAPASQATLTVSNSATHFLAKQSVVLTARGGSGSGAVTFHVTGAKCVYKAATRTLSAATPTTCAVTATKAASRGYLSATSAAKTFVFAPLKLTITNTNRDGNVGAPIMVTADGGSAKGTLKFSVTGDGCTIDAVTGALNASALANCAVTASKVSGSKTNEKSAPATFTFIAPTVTHPDVATLTSVTGAVGAQIDDTANGLNYFIRQYYNSNDHWYGNYIDAGSTITLNWHVAGPNGLPMANAPVTLRSNLNYSSCTYLTTWNVASLNNHPGCYTPDPEGTLTGTTDMNGDVSFTITNTNDYTGNRPWDMTSVWGMEGNEGPYVWTDMLLQVGNDTYTGNPATQVNQATDRVDFIVIPHAPAPTVANPNVATLTSVTGTVGSQIDDTANGLNYFIRQYYNSNDHWYGNYIHAGATVTTTWHVVGADGLPLRNQAVTLRSNLNYSQCNYALTWDVASLNNHPGCYSPGTEGTLTGTTDANGDVTFTFTNTNTAPGSTPSDLTTTGGMETNEGSYPWTAMVLQVADNIYTGDPNSNIVLATDRVDFIVIP